MDERQTTVNLVSEFLDARGFNYDVRSDGRSLRATYLGRNGWFNVLIVPQGDRLHLDVLVPMSFVVPENRRPQMAETIVRANDGLGLGGFDMDFSDGTVEFRASMPIADATLTAEQFHDLLGCAFMAADYYFPAFNRLLYGDDLSPAEVIAEVEMAW